MQDTTVTQLVALVAFVGTYAGLAVGRLPLFRVDRTGVAIIGAVLTVVAGVLPWDAAVAAVDVHTLALLFGMMIVTAYLRLSGFFRLVTSWAVRLARAPVSLLAVVIGVAGVLSALFVNDVVCPVLAPLVIELTRQLELPPVPYLIALATASNVGSVATLTGNPQNMLVGSFSGIGYRSFLWRQGPVAVVGLLLVLLVALVAISGAVYTLLTRRVKPAKVYREINWQLLVLFTGLFVVIGGVEAAGLTTRLLGWAEAMNLQRPLVLTAASAVLSNLVSNVPAVLLLKSLVPSFAEPGRAWLVVAMASTFAGNLTLVGSVANLIVVEAARGARIDVGFGEYCRVGVPLTLLTLLLGWCLLGLMPAP